MFNFVPHRSTLRLAQMAAAALMLAIGMQTGAARADCSFSSFWSGGCNKNIENALTPPPPSQWVAPPGSSPVCGGNGKRPCTVTERIPSCDEGLTESIAQNKCVDTPPGKLPFLATLNEMGQLAIAAGQQGQAQCLTQGNAAAQAAPSGIFNSDAFKTVSADRLKYVGIGFGCAAPRILDSFEPLAELDPLFWRNFEIAFNQKFNSKPCAETKDPSTRAACAVGSLVIGDAFSETACMVKAAQHLSELGGGVSEPNTISAYNQLGEAVFILIQWSLEQYVSTRLAGPAKEKFKQKVMDKTIARDMAAGKTGPGLVRDYGAQVQSMDRAFKILSRVMMARAVDQLYTKMQAIPECKSVVGQGLDVTAAMAQAAGSIAQGTRAAVASGSLYLIDAQGQLLYFKHDNHGRFTVSGQVIGAGWSGFLNLGAAQVPSGGGALYAITSNGDLLYYEHDAAGKFTIEGRKIGNDWTGLKHFLVAKQGQLYLVRQNGDLEVFLHNAAFNFHTHRKIGVGWGDFTRVFSGGSNAFYVQNGDGNLRYYYHDDSYTFVVGNKVIGNGWDFPNLASAGNGEVYAVNGFGDLLFYRHDSQHRWIDGSGRAIGIGFANPGKFGLIVAAR